MSWSCDESLAEGSGVGHKTKLRDLEAWLKLWTRPDFQVGPKSPKLFEIDPGSTGWLSECLDWSPRPENRSLGTPQPFPSFLDHSRGSKPLKRPLCEPLLCLVSFPRVIGQARSSIPMSHLPTLGQVCSSIIVRPASNRHT